MALERNAAAAKSVADEAICAGFRVTPQDVQHPFWMRQIPMFAATARGQTGEHQLRAHCAVANKTALAQGFEQGPFHLVITPADSTDAHPAAGTES
jgi:hypothetical protein